MSEEKSEVVRTVASVSVRPTGATPKNTEQLRKLTASLREKDKSLQEILALAEKSLRFLGERPMGRPDMSMLRVFERLESIKKIALKGLK